VKLERTVFKNYEHSCKDVACYLKLKLYPPKPVEEAFKYNLTVLRAHLEDMGIKMPIQLFPYDKNDETTHKYVMGFQFGMPHINENYIYKKDWKLSRNAIDL
jgi:hypothetical protein